MKNCILIIGCAALLASCVRTEYRTERGAAWGTTYAITYNADRDMADSIIRVINDIDMSLSPFQAQSTVSKINRNESAQTDRMFGEVFALSQEVCRASGGAFDPTIAPLINLWGFGYKHGDAASVTQEQIDSALALVGILQCSIDADGIIAKKHPATEFNFSAIAKGYGVDQVANMLKRNGINDYMVEIGGEIALSGRNAHGEDWRIQIDSPVPDEGAVNHERMQMLQLTDCAIATSGNYRNYRETGRGRVGHTISPATGCPIATSTLSATVIAPNCALADALATAVMALPDSAARATLARFPAARAIIASLAPDSTLTLTEL